MITETIAVDFDGVIHTYEHGWKNGTIYGDLVPGALEALTVLMNRYAVFIHTARDARQVARWIEQRTGHGIECTTPMHPLLPSWWQWGKRFTFCNTKGTLLVTNRKLPAVAYIGDRPVKLTDWREAMRELSVRGYNAPMQPDETKRDGQGSSDRAAELAAPCTNNKAPNHPRTTPSSAWSTTPNSPQPSSLPSTRCTTAKQAGMTPAPKSKRTPVGMSSS